MTVVITSEEPDASAQNPVAPTLADLLVASRAHRQAAAASAASADEDAEATAADREAVAEAAENVDTKLNLVTAAAAESASILRDFKARFLGSLATDPETGPNEAPLIEGALYFNSASTSFRIYSAGEWQAATGRLLPTSGAPDDAFGLDGDFALDVTASKLYGPKDEGDWPAGVSLVGIAGRSVTAASVNGSNHLILTLSDASTVDAGLFPIGPGIASTVSVTPVGDIAATNAQAALAELDTKKQALAARNQANGYAGLGSDGKIDPSLLPDAVIGALKYQGTWNAATNSPTIAAAAGANKGHYRVVTTAGTTTIDGINDWEIGDWIISNGSSWSKVDNTDQVTSVVGLKGVITQAALKTALALAIADISGLQTALDAKAALAANTFTGKQTVPASAAGGAGLNLPHGSAPTSPGNGDLWTTTAGLFARVNGATVGPFGAGAGAATISRSARTSSTMLGTSDMGKFIEVTANSFTQTFDAAATLGAGWWCYYANYGDGDVFFDPNGSEQIDGLTSYVSYPSEVRLIVCTGTAFETLVLAPFFKVFTTFDTFYKPPGYKRFGGKLWGAGGSGGCGSSGYGGGGGGGACLQFLLAAAAMSASTTVQIGAGGSQRSPGQNGASGNSSSFSGFSAPGGGGGFNTNGYGGGGGGLHGDGQNADSGGGGAGGEPQLTNSNNNAGGGGRGSGGALVGGSSIDGGGGGGGGNGVGGGKSINGGGGGGGAGGQGGTSLMGGSGGQGGFFTNGTDGAAPGGGGGGCYTNASHTSGAGGRGELQIWGVA